MPEPLIHYWTAWNEPDLAAVRAHLDRAVEVGVEWNDPRDSFVGIDALEAAIGRLRSGKPEYRFVIASEVDHHHGRYRYRWDMSRRGRVLMEGQDIATIGSASGLINRVDGFFGGLTPVDHEAGGVPAELR
ncbi:MAG: nuclear transport factor 2 family protein [Acidimicrobiales bacterium]